jgi:hypothetical protein
MRRSISGLCGAMSRTQLFPVLVVLLEGGAGLVYLWTFWQGSDPKHGWLALTWLMYAAAAVGLAMVGD